MNFLKFSGFSFYFSLKVKPKPFLKVLGGFLAILYKRSYKNVHLKYNNVLISLKLHNAGAERPFAENSVYNGLQALTLHQWSAAIHGYKLLNTNMQGRRGGGCCLPYKKIGRLHRKKTLKKQQWTSGDLIGENQRPHQQRESHCWCLLQSALPRGACWWNALISTMGSITLIGFESEGELLSPWHCWKNSTASCKLSGRHLDSIQDNLSTQAIDNLGRSVVIPVAHLHKRNN